MARFNLNAQIVLRAPTNLKKVADDIRAQLSGINVAVDVTISSKSIASLNKAKSTLTSVAKAAKTSGDTMEDFGRQAALAVRRFGAFTAATFAFRKLTTSISSGINEAIEFQREVVRIAQVAGTSVRSLSNLTGEITRLAKGFGVSSSELARASVILKQAGLSSDETRKSLEALAKSDISPSFDSIGQTAEGVIAIFRQFRIEAGELEGVLGSINAVSKSFAVESSDLIAAIRRTGAAFEASGGQLNELIALFTSVRATTRESAESIATGFRTIFTRLQRTRTINFLEALGISLRDLEGQFVGPFEAVRRLSIALEQIPSTDPRFAQIVEELGGFRQISKVIPLIQQFSTAQQALNVAQAGSGSLAEDAAKGQEALAIQIKKVREEFQELVRNFTNTSSFQLFIDTSLKLASALIKVADALVPVTGALATLAFPVAAVGIKKFLGSVKGGGFLGHIAGKNKGGLIKGFATGGLVPGSGNRDTVPAMLQPGEFVLRKKAVEALGVDRAKVLNKASGGAIPFNNFVFGGLQTALTTNLIKNLSITEKQKLSQLNAGKNAFSAGENIIVDDTGKTARIARGAPVKFDDKTLGFVAAATGKGKGKKRTVKPKTFQIDSDIAVGFNIPTRRGSNSLSAGVSSVIGKDKDGVLLNKLGFASRASIKGSTIQSGKNTAIGTLFSNLSAEFFQRTKNPIDRFYAGSVKSVAGNISRKTGTNNKGDITPLEENELRTVAGYIFEGVTERILKSKRASGTANFDFPSGFGSDASTIFDIQGTNPDVFTSGKPVELKTSDTPDAIASSLRKFLKVADPSQIKKFAKGGSPTDTVPALLTPGEFVFSKNAVKSIGLGNLKKLNDVKGFAKGGPVGFAPGGVVGGGGFANVAGFAVAAQLIPSLLGLDDKFSGLTKTITTLTITFASLNAISKSLSNTNLVTKITGGISDESFAAQNTEITARRKRLRTLSRSAALGTISPEEGTELFNLGRQRASDAATRRDIVARRQIQQKNQRLGFGAVAAGAVAITGGQFLSDIGSERIQAGDASGVGFAQAGAALSGAGQGAALGAAFGLFGIVIGTAAGAATGFASAASNAAKQLKSVRFADTVKEFESAIGRVTSGIEPFDARVDDFNRFSKDLISRFADTSKGSPERQQLEGVLQNSRAGFDTLISNLAKTSNSFNQLENTVGQETLRNFLILNNIPYSEIKDRIEKEIKARKASEKIEKDATEATDRFTNSIRNIIAVNSAFQDAATKANLLANTFNELSSFDFSSVIERAGAGQLTDTGLFNQALDRLGGLDAGKSVTDLIGEAQQSQKVIAGLPDILLKLRSQDPLGLGSQFSETLGNKIKDLIGGGGDSGDILRKIIVSRAEKIIGSEGKDERIITEINNDLLGVAGNLTSGFDEVFKTLSGANKALESVLEHTAKIAEQRRKVQQELLQGELKSVELQSQRDQLFRDLDNRPLDFFAAQNAETQRSKLINPQGLNAAALGINLNVQNQSLQAFNRAIATGTDNLGGLNVAQAQVQEKVDELKGGLEFLADATSRTAVEFAELNKLTADRRTVQSVAQNFAFGGNNERLAVNRGLAGAVGLLNGKGTLNDIPDQLRSEILSFLQSLGSSKKFAALGDRTGQEAINELNARAFQNFSPELAALLQDALTPEEVKLRLAIEAKFNEAIAAQNELNKFLKDERNSLDTILSTNFSSFLTELKKLVNSQLATSAERDVVSAKANLDRLNEVQQNAFRFNALIGNGFDITKAGGIEAAITIVTQSQKLQQAKEGLTNLDPIREIIARLRSNLVLDRSNDETGLRRRTTLAAQALNSGAFSEIQKAGVTEAIIGGDKSPVTRANELQKILDAREKELKLQKKQAELRGGRAGLNLDKANFLLNSIKSEDLVRLGTSITNATKAFKEAVDKLDKIRADAPLERAIGGIVPGAGNRDSVSALLTPGEFVLRKDAVRDLGPDFLEMLNENKFARGGVVSREEFVKKLLERRRTQAEDKQTAKDKLANRRNDSFGRSLRRDKRLADQKAARLPGLAHQKLARLDSEIAASARLEEFNKKNAVGNDPRLIAFRESRQAPVNDPRLEAFRKNRQEPVEDPRLAAFRQRSAARKEAAKQASTLLAQRQPIPGVQLFNRGPNREKPLRIDDSNVPFALSPADFSQTAKALKDPNREKRGLPPIDVTGGRPEKILEDALIERVKRAMIRRGQKSFNGISRQDLLDTAVRFQQKGIRFAIGGSVPGAGSGDTVPALLTPGEFVLNKGAVQQIGVENLHSANKKGRARFQNGGSVGGGTLAIDPASMSAFQSTVNAFSGASATLSKALDNFPREVQHTFNGTLEVIVNGAEAFAKMSPEIEKLVMEKVQSGINNMLKDKFPDVGQVD